MVLIDVANMLETILEGGVGPRLGNVFFEDDGSQTLWATLLNPSSSGFDSVSLL